MKLETGAKCSKNFKLDQRIDTMWQLCGVLESEKSMFLRHRPYPVKFLRHWTYERLSYWVRTGKCWTIKAIIGSKEE